MIPRVPRWPVVDLALQLVRIGWRRVDVGMMSFARPAWMPPNPVGVRCTLARWTLGRPRRTWPIQTYVQSHGRPECRRCGSTGIVIAIRGSTCPVCGRIDPADLVVPILTYPSQCGRCDKPVAACVCP